MFARQRATLEATQRVQRFLKMADTLLITFEGTVHAELDEGVTSSAEPVDDQKVNNRGTEQETAKEGHLRRTSRRSLMAPMTVIARWARRRVAE